MRFAMRCFLLSFVPVALLLTGVFWTVRTIAVSAVRDELRSSLRQTQLSMARLQSKSQLEDNRFLRVVGDNAPLKAGLQLMAAEGNSPEARRTVEDQLREICRSLGLDFLIAANADGTPLAGVMRGDDGFLMTNIGGIRPPERGFFSTGGQTYQVTSVPLVQDDENIGKLSVGELFDLADFSTPVVLTQRNKIVKSSLTSIPAAELEAALGRCDHEAECELRLGGQSYLSLAMNTTAFGDGYVLRTLQNIDSAIGPIQAVLRNVFAIAAVVALIAALGLGVISARWIVQPLARVISHLHESAQTGAMPEFESKQTDVLEIRELADSFNHAAAMIREAQAGLRNAYLEFVRSLASALDARDCYTAGHSRRVSERASAIAQAMGLSPQELDEIRIGALLHDIGKIGISDSLLQKPNQLTAEEFKLIQQHPVIGRTILEGVNGFQSYLSVVELHHENWDGTGYPHGRLGNEVPLGARIVHVVDAYDAMTSDRPYRRGMAPRDALAVLERFAGSQFDPIVVSVFRQLLAGSPATGLATLADAVDRAEMEQLEKEAV